MCDERTNARVSIYPGGFHRFSKAVTGDAGVNDSAPGHKSDGGGDELSLVGGMNRGGFAGGAQREDAVNAAFEEMPDDSIHGRFINTAVGSEWGHHGDDDATK